MKRILQVIKTLYLTDPAKCFVNTIHTAVVCVLLYILFSEVIEFGFVGRAADHLHDALNLCLTFSITVLLIFSLTWIVVQINKALTPGHKDKSE